MLLEFLRSKKKITFKQVIDFEIWKIFYPIQYFR